MLLAASIAFDLSGVMGSVASNSTHLLASCGPWHTAVMHSINGPLISKAFFSVSVSSRRVTIMPVSGSLP